MTYPVGQPLHDNSHGHVGIDDAFRDGHAHRTVIAGGLDSGGCSAMTYGNYIYEPMAVRFRDTLERNRRATKD